MSREISPPRAEAQQNFVLASSPSRVFAPRYGVTPPDLHSTQGGECVPSPLGSYYFFRSQLRASLLTAARPRPAQTIVFPFPPPPVCLRKPAPSHESCFLLIHKQE